MDQLKLEKIEKLQTMNHRLDKCYGEFGTQSRLEFSAKALAYGYGEIIKQKRIELKITQEQLAHKIGKKRPYISKIEKGETDLQLSSFIDIIHALGMHLEVVSGIDNL